MMHPNQELRFENIKMCVLLVDLQNVDIKVGLGDPAQNDAMFTVAELRGGEDVDGLEIQVRTDRSLFR